MLRFRKQIISVVLQNTTLPRFLIHIVMKIDALSNVSWVLERGNSHLWRGRDYKLDVVVPRSRIHYFLKNLDLMHLKLSRKSKIFWENLFSTYSHFQVTNYIFVNVYRFRNSFCYIFHQKSSFRVPEDCGYHLFLKRLHLSLFRRWKALMNSLHGFLFMEKSY